MSLNHDMRVESHTVAQNRIRAGRAEWTDLDILAQSGGVIDDGCRVNGNRHLLSAFRNRRQSALRIDDHSAKFRFRGPHIIDRGEALELPQRPFCTHLFNVEFEH